MWMGNISELAYKQLLTEKNIPKFNEDFIKKNYDENSNKDYIPEVDVEYLKNIHDLDKDSLLLPE